MKKLLFTVVILLLCGSFNKAYTHDNCSYQTIGGSESSPIDLLGDLENSGPRSLFPPIYLMQYPDYLEASFIGNLGLLTVSVYDELHTLVYYNTVDTSKESRSIIDISDFAEGEYSIKFTNSSGKYLSGYFTVRE